MKRVAVLGSTGSIGVSTLDVLARHPDRYRVTALAAGANRVALFDQCLRFRPAVAVLQDPAAARLLALVLRAGAPLLEGQSIRPHGPGRGVAEG